MRQRSDMKDYQEEAVSRAVERQRLALLLAPGDGKTVVALTTFLDAHAFPALVVAPALVVETHVWSDEARAWQHLRHLRVAELTGSPEQRWRALSVNPEPDVVVVSYDNFMWLTDEMDVGENFAAIAWDELSKMKHAGTHRFKRSRSRKGGRDIGFRLGLTGSPVGNHVADLWGELFTIGGPAVLGPTFQNFKDSWLEPYDFYGRVWNLKGMRVAHRSPIRLAATPASRRLERQLFKKVRSWTYARPTAERDGVPPVREVDRRLALPPAAATAMQELRSQLWTKLPSGAELEVLSRGVAAMKVRQLAGGAVYRAPATDLAAWEEVHDAKVRAVVELVDELQGEPLLLFYEFDHERQRLLAALKGREVRWVGDGPGAVRAWNDRRVEVLLAQPQAGGMGLNLQAGGHHVGWFTLPWARWEYDQGCGRLARLGQVAPEVTSHRFLCGPVDDDVAAVLATKGAAEQRFMAAMR